MCIVFVCMRFVKNVGCHYNQSGLLKIEILILLRLTRFRILGTLHICLTCRIARTFAILFRRGTYLILQLNIENFIYAIYFLASADHRVGLLNFDYGLCQRSFLSKSIKVCF